MSEAPRGGGLAGWWADLRAGRPAAERAEPLSKLELAGVVLAAPALVGIYVLDAALGRTGAIVFFPPGIAGALIGSVAVATLQLAGTLAGRGRALPFARVGPLARFGLALLLVLLSAGRAPVLTGASLAFLAGCEAAARRGLPSLAVAAFATEWLAIGVLSLGVATPLAAFLPALAVAQLAILVWISHVLRRLGLGTSRLARLGITPWSPGELALVPTALAGLLAAIAYGLGGTDALEALFVRGWGLVWLPLVLALGEAFALQWLERRLREAERFAAARAAAAGAEAPVNPAA